MRVFFEDNKPWKNQYAYVCVCDTQWDRWQTQFETNKYMQLSLLSSLDRSWSSIRCLSLFSSFSSSFFFFFFLSTSHSSSQRSRQARTNDTTWWVSALKRTGQLTDSSDEKKSTIDVTHHQRRQDASFMLIRVRIEDDLDCVGLKIFVYRRNSLNFDVWSINQYHSWQPDGFVLRLFRCSHSFRSIHSSIMTQLTLSVRSSAIMVPSLGDGGGWRDKVLFFILQINGELVIISRFFFSFSEGGTSLVFSWFVFRRRKFVSIEFCRCFSTERMSMDKRNDKEILIFTKKKRTIPKARRSSIQCRAERENFSRFLSPTGREIFFFLEKIFERRSHRHSTSDGRCSVGQQMGGGGRGEDTGRFVFVCRPFALPLTERGNVRVKSTDEDKTIRGHWDPLPRHLHHWIHSNQETRRAGGIFFSSGMNTAKRRLIWIFVHYSKVI